MNTIHKGKRRDWTWTLPNYTESDEVFLNTLVEDDNTVSYLCYGKEICPTTDTPHLQGYIRFNNAIRFESLKQMFGNKFHIEPARSGPDKNITYCSKDGSFFEFGKRPEQGKRTDIDRAIDLIHDGVPKRARMLLEPRAHAMYPAFLEQVDYYHRLDKIQPDNLIMKPWQRDVWDMIFNEEGGFKEVEPRTIIWIWSPESSTGKTTFMKYIQYRYPHDVIAVPDLSHANIIMMYNQESLMHINLPRDIDEQLTTVCSLLEKLSDRGIRSSGKYAGKTVFLDHLHIVVTSNIPPPHDKLPDRFIEIKASHTFRTIEDHNFWLQFE